MPHIIHLPTQQLEQEFEDLLDYCVLNYHHTRYNTPSNIPDYGPATEAELYGYAGYGWLGFDPKLELSDADGPAASPPGRKSKRAIYHTNPDTCNGLPRRKR